MLRREVQGSVHFVYPADHLPDRPDIIVRLVGKTYHEVQLYMSPAEFDRLLYGRENIIFRDAFVDRVSQSLSTGFDCKCKSLLLVLLYLVKHRE